MSTEYHHNHYVPVWYQKRFIPTGQTDRELYYLDLKPGSFTDPRGIRHELNGLHRWGPKRCFAEKYLYTTYFGSEESTGIEQAFFGPVDQNGKKGVDYFTDFTHPSVDYDAASQHDDIFVYPKDAHFKGPGLAQGPSWDHQP